MSVLESGHGDALGRPGTEAGDMARERRWIILADDGRHVTLGRDSDPSDAEVAQTGDGLRMQGLGGWLAMLEGHYYQSRSPISLLMVRAVAPSSGPTWENAEAAFRRLRDDATRAA